MKTLGLLANKKIMAAIIVIAIIGVYFVTSDSIDWEEGAPEAAIVCNINGMAGSSLTGSTNVGGNTVIGQMVPLTTFTSNVPTLDANTQYTISFAATMSTKTAKFGEALTNSISVTGKTGGSAPDNNYLDINSINTVSASVAGTAGSTSTLNIPAFTGRIDGNVISQYSSIMGDVIDGSVFTFVISSTATDGRTSSTTATLTITVDNGGTIYLSVDTITVNLVASLYPDGWNVPGNANYIKITYVSGTTYSISYYNQLLIPAQGVWSGTLPAIQTFLGTLKTNGNISQIQYDCGIAQIVALGG